MATGSSRAVSATAAPTSMGSASAKASGAAGCAPTSSPTASEDSSPSPRALKVTVICRSAGELHLLGVSGEAHPHPGREPGDHREVAVHGPGPPPLHLDQPPGAFGLKDAGGA